MNHSTLMRPFTDGGRNVLGDCRLECLKQEVRNSNWFLSWYVGPPPSPTGKLATQFQSSHKIYFTTAESLIT